MATQAILDKYDMTIGIECHVQLATQTKLFSTADNDARDAEPNSKVVPLDYGLPGMLPVLNWEAVKLAVKAGKALGSEIALRSHFDRKHYFYPDLPKGYQTTQMYEPIIGPGLVKAPLEDGSAVDVRIHHAHMEEDAGKLTHFDGYSLVDLNRAGTPLIEIVSEPDIHSSAGARAYATELYRLMTYAGVTHGDLYHGNMRFDVNISVAPKGAAELGKRAEVKNLNSFRSVERAAEYEFNRQVDLLERGEKVVQETRGWDDDKQLTVSQRSKEDAQDYRYMPDPDIPPIVLTAEEVAEIQAGMPKLPSDYRANWQSLQLDNSVMTTILAHAPIAETIDAIHESFEPGITKRVVNWFSSASADDIDVAKVQSGLVGPNRLSELSQMVADNKLSSTGAKEIFLYLFDDESKGKMPEDIARERNLLQVSDTGAIATVVEEVLADPASAKALADVRAGNDKAIGYLVGQVMKKSKGQANPGLAQQLIRERL
ncbi:Asp-tRNA(Asn)/Glu-tRNA(Gln) amidotransferase subunit GatB [Candidatus Mycosynbacter amalyticus]|uniref:Aspartyl/glutamyl-tRNA(Asn/Gln) amidotransferase subunit B n=1 Tax=Candidatus Mycosynbacter amalyticus TaxID=2665156 RepID=A0A857MM84_9BACT|nr:Asp-tRNA(Asn)/Glu-tRNA(Gln) amidotransferase subunit GatB [Candidatus Mycosynbacter amalyticus]QHN42925.1 Asp-tRNA(Asn)/Glu-tRNA(Gln) amidotransferase subunit GatB [Candidatus Mycosynbacter amalyticus]